MRHIIIWQGENAGLHEFVQGLSNNRKLASRCKDLVYLIAAHSPLPTGEAEGIPYTMLPEKPDDAAQWKNVLTSVYKSIACQIQPGDDPLNVLELSIIISAAQTSNSRSMLEAIRAAARTIAAVHFHLHIVLLMDIFTMHKEGQVQLLSTLMQDVRNADTLKKEKSSAELTIESDCEARKAEEISERKQSGNLSLDEVDEINAKWAQEKNTRIKEAHAALEAKYPVLPWELLTVLTDQDEHGAHTPEIAAVRADMLASLVLSSNISDDLFRCLTYAVQRSEFTLMDIQQLPNHLLYEKICQMHEDIQEARKKLCPENWRNTISAQIRKNINSKRPQLCAALLADDDNYPSRSGQKLLDTFMVYNKELLCKLLGIEEIAQDWLLDAKRLLVGWIDVDQPVQDYIVSDVNGLEQDIRNQINDEPRYRGKMFGASKKLKDRRMAANELLNDELCSCMATCCMERVLTLLPMLRSFLNHMQDVNSELFAHYDITLNKKLSKSDWAIELAPALHNFTLKDLSIPDEALSADGYRAWLVNLLHERYVPFVENPTIEGLSDADYAAFITKATEYVTNAPIFKMISKTFGATTQAADSGVLLLGAENHIYRLAPFWLTTDHLNSNTIASIFVEQVEDSVTPSEPTRQIPPNTALCKNMTWHKKELDMHITLQVEHGHIALAWNRPTDEVNASVSITDESGSKCYFRNDEYDYGDGKTPAITLQANKLPFGKKLKITVAGESTTCTQVRQLEPIEIRKLAYDKLKGVKALMANLSFSDLHWRIAIDKDSKFKDIPFDQWAMAVDTRNGVFKYPIQRDDTWLLLLLDDSEPRIRMIVRGAE